MLAISDVSTMSMAKAKQALTVAWSELPSWQQDNQYILSGYRPQSNSFKRSFKSLAYLHNETVNVYSHLIPAFVDFSQEGGEDENKDATYFLI